MAEFQWQIILARILRGGLKLQAVFEKNYLCGKFAFFERLRVVNCLQVDERKEKVFKMQMKQVFVLKLYSFCKAIMSLIQRRQRNAMRNMSMKYMEMLQHEALTDQSTLLMNNFQQHIDQINPVMINEEFYERIKQNKGKKKQSL